MSDTPLTDAVAYTGKSKEIKYGIVSADFARSLERELNEAVGALEALFTCYEGVYDMAVPQPYQSNEAKYAEELARAFLAKKGKG